MNRNLKKNNYDYCYCDLSPISIKNSADVLEEILCVIEEKFEMERSVTERNKIKQINQILCNAGAKKITIVIDELSVKENLTFIDIASDLLNLVTHFCNNSEQEDMKFVVSTISAPEDIIENRSKAAEYFQDLNCDDWSADIAKLFDVLNVSLNLNLSNIFKEQILDSSQFSPRILKSIFRKIVSVDDLNSNAIDRVIELTISELVR